MPYKWWNGKGVALNSKGCMMDPDRYYVPINDVIESVRGPMSLPERVKIEDDTLREGVEAPHGLWRRTEIETRVKVAKALHEAGIKEVQVGFVATDPIAQQLVKALQEETPELKMVAHISADKANIDATADRGVNMGWMIFGVDDFRLQNYGWCRKDSEAHIIEDLCGRITKGVEYAKERGMYVRAGVSTPACAPLTRMVSVYKAAFDAHADGTTVMDGWGTTIPETMKFIVGIARSIFGPNKDIETHCHDDYGLGTANAIAAVTAGCNVVDCAVNGLGDRAGQAALEEVASILEILYGVDTGVKLEKLIALSKMVSELYGISVQPNKAIVGDNMYIHEEDPHIASVFRAKKHWSGFNAINPKYLGAREQLHWGASSLHKGPNSCTALKIGQMGLTYTEKQFDEIISRITDAVKMKRYATEEEVEIIVKEILKK